MKKGDLEEKKAALTAYAEQLADEDKPSERSDRAKKSRRRKAVRTAAVAVVAALSVGAIAGLAVALKYS